MRLNHSDLKLLLSLDALLSELNVTKAARRLGISQPALSSELARLRDLFQDQLFVPTARGLTPTPRAMELRQPLHDALERLIALYLSEQSFDPASSTRVFVMSMTDLGHYAVVADLARTFHANAPQAGIAFVPFDPKVGMTALETLEIDFVVAVRDLLPPDVLSLPLFYDHHVVVHRRGHPRGDGPISLEEYCQLEHVIMSVDATPMQNAFDLVLETSGCSRKVAVALPNYGAVRPLISNSDLIVTMSERVARATMSDHVILPLPIEQPTICYAVGWHPKHRDDPGHMWFRRLLRSVGSTTASDQTDR